MKTNSKTRKLTLDQLKRIVKSLNKNDIYFLAVEKNKKIEFVTNNLQDSLGLFFLGVIPTVFMRLTNFEVMYRLADKIFKLVLDESVVTKRERDAILCYFRDCLIKKLDKVEEGKK